MGVVKAHALDPKPDKTASFRFLLLTYLVTAMQSTVNSAGTALRYHMFISLLASLSPLSPLSPTSILIYTLSFLATQVISVAWFFHQGNHTALSTHPPPEDVPFIAFLISM